MGRPNPALRIAVWQPWINHPAIEALAAAGHDVDAYPAPHDPDLILHPAAHGWHDALWPYLEVALKAARKRRKEKK